MNPCALGLTIMARSHGSLKVSPGLAGPPAGACATTDGLSPTRLAATVVCGGNAVCDGATGVARAVTEPIEGLPSDAVRSGGLIVGPAWAGVPSLGRRSESGHGVRVPGIIGSALLGRRMSTERVVSSGSCAP